MRIFGRQIFLAFMLQSAKETAGIGRQSAERGFGGSGRGHPFFPFDFDDGGSRGGNDDLEDGRGQKFISGEGTTQPSKQQVGAKNKVMTVGRLRGRAGGRGGGVCRVIE